MSSKELVHQCVKMVSLNIYIRLKTCMKFSAKRIVIPKENFTFKGYIQIKTTSRALAGISFFSGSFNTPFFLSLCGMTSL